MFELELVDPNVSIKFASVAPDGLVQFDVVGILAGGKTLVIVFTGFRCFYYGGVR